jgi:hypothetical protein
MAVWLPLLAVLDHRRLSANWRRAAIWAIGGALLPALYQWVYFGSLVPHTMTAKKLVYQLDLGAAALILVDHALPAALPLPAVISRAVFVLGLGALLVFAALQLRRGRGDTPAGAVVPVVVGLGGLAIPTVYLLSRGLVFPWYTPLFNVPLAWCAAVGVSRARRPWSSALFLLVLVVPSAWGLASSGRAVLGRPDAYRYFDSNARTRKYIEVGRRLVARYPDATLLSSEIGGLGWGFSGRVEDGVGLITPAALRHHPLAVPEQRSAGYIGAIPAAYVRELRPEIVVSLDIFIEELMRDPVLREYRGLTEPIYVKEDLPFAPVGGLWGSTRLNVLLRRDLPATP